MSARVVHIGARRKVRRIERAIAVGAGLAILAQIHGSFGLFGLAVTLLCACVVALALAGLRRVGR